METLDIEYVHVYLETLENTTKQREEFAKLGVPRDGRHIKLQILAIGMHTCVTMDGYKRLRKHKETNFIWISLNVRLLHRKVCYLLS